MLKDIYQQQTFLTLVKQHTELDCKVAEETPEQFNGEVLILAHLRCVAAAVITITQGNLLKTRDLFFEVNQLLAEELNLGLISTGNIDQSAINKGSVM